MRVTARGNSAELKRQFDAWCACEYRGERYRTQLAGRQRMLRGALDEDPIVDQPHQDARQRQRLTAAQTDPLHRLLAVDRYAAGDAYEPRGCADSARC